MCLHFYFWQRGKTKFFQAVQFACLSFLLTGIRKQAWVQLCHDGAKAVTLGWVHEPDRRDQSPEDNSN